MPLLTKCMHLWLICVCHSGFAGEVLEPKHLDGRGPTSTGEEGHNTDPVDSTYVRRMRCSPDFTILYLSHAHRA